MNSAPIASQENSSAAKVKAAFHVVLTVHGDTPAHRAVVMAEADIGVMFTARPQPSMQAKARTAGEMPKAAGLGMAAPSRAMTATGLRPSWPVAIRMTGTSSGTPTGGR